MNTFSKAKRIRQPSDYQYVFEKADKIKQYPFLALHRSGLAENGRLGLAISKKKIPKAHERNRFKRIIRESFRKKSLNSVDIVIVIVNGHESFENAYLFRQLGKIWARLESIYAN